MDRVEIVVDKKVCRATPLRERLKKLAFVDGSGGEARECQNREQKAMSEQWVKVRGIWMSVVGEREFRKAKRSQYIALG